MSKKEANRRYYEKIKSDPELLKKHREKALNYYKKNRETVRDKMKIKLRQEEEKKKRTRLSRAYRKDNPGFSAKVEKNFVSNLQSNSDERVEEIKVIRKRKGLTQKEMAEKLGISAIHYSRIEVRRRRLTNELYAKIFECLK